MRSAARAGSPFGLSLVALMMISIGCSKAPETLEAKSPPRERAVLSDVGAPAAKIEPSEPIEASADAEAEAPKGITTENLQRHLPAMIRGVPRRIMDPGAFGGDAPEGFVAASYELHDAQGRRFVNINLQKVQDLAFEKAQFRVGDGQERESAGSAYRGRMVGGRLAQRAFSHNMGSSEVIVLLDDAISVHVSIEKAANPDEAFEILELIDLDELAALAEAS